MGKQDDRQGAGWSEVDAGWDGVMDSPETPAHASRGPEEVGFEDEAVTSQGLTDSARLLVDQRGPQISVRPVTDESELAGLEEPEVALPDDEDSKETVKRLKAISTETERRLVLEARRAVRGTPEEETARAPSTGATPGAVPAGTRGPSLAMPSPPRPVPPPAAPREGATRPASRGSSLGLLVFVALLILALGSVAAVIYAAFF